ncbi:hypothetical protein LVY75_22705 [Sinorhizobium sp. B11]
MAMSAEGPNSGGNGSGGGEDAAPENVLFPEDAPSPGSDKDGDGSTENRNDTTDQTGDDAADRVPDDGRYALTMPEGIEVDQELIDALGPDFHTLGLTNRQAQQLADRFIEIQGRRGKAAGEAWAGRVQGWADEARKDREIGGAKWAGNRRLGAARTLPPRYARPARVPEYQRRRQPPRDDQNFRKGRIDDPGGQPTEWRRGRKRQESRNRAPDVSQRRTEGLIRHGHHWQLLPQPR